MSAASGSSIADAAAECLRARESYNSASGSWSQDGLNSVGDLKKVKAAYDSNLKKIGDQLQLTPRESTEFLMYHQYSAALRLLGDPRADLKAHPAFTLDVIGALQQEIRRLSVDEGKVSVTFHQTSSGCWLYLS